MLSACSVSPSTIVPLLSFVGRVGQTGTEQEGVLSAGPGGLTGQRQRQGQLFQHEVPPRGDSVVECLQKDISP